MNMKRFSIFILLMSLCPLLQAAEVPFQGNYECNGKKPGFLAGITGESYKILLKIEKNKKTYFISTHYNGAAYTGTGIYDATNKSLSAAITNSANPKETYVIIFHELSQTKLEAQWAYLTENGIAFCEKK